MDIIKKINKATHIWQVLSDLDAKDLENVIQISAEKYYNSNVSLISDDTYDILIKRLTQIKPNSPVLRQIGAPAKGKKIELPYWMGSMDKIKSDENLIIKWTNNYDGPYIISDKLDGISCLLTINNDEISLYTRGDGKYGQNISHLINLIKISNDNFQKIPNKTVVRGELIMTKNNFQKYADLMSNARNMVAGIVNSKEKSINKNHAKNVIFVAYELIKPANKPDDQMKLLKNWNLNVVYFDIYDYVDLNILDDILKKRKKKSKYEIDGIVITDNNKHARNISGNPSYSFAYKGMTGTSDVKVIEILWKPSKNGILVPRIHFEKIRLSQADLEYATGFNARFIVDNNIGPGAIITIIRSGDVIPYVLNVIKPVKKPSLPDNLDYVWDKTGVNIILENVDDNEIVIIQRITNFMKYIGAENISEGIVTKLVVAGYDDIFKIVTLTIDDFLSLPGFKETLANKLYNNLEYALDNLDILTLMAASNIFGRGFGKRKLKKILDVYPNIVSQYSSKTHQKWANNLLGLDGFDTITVDHFLKSLPDFQYFYKKISKILKIEPHSNQIKGGLFYNDTVVFTGFRNKIWEKFIENEGGKISSSVSKNTTLLIYNDGEEASIKYQTALKNGTKVMAKSKFAKKYKL